MTVSFRSKYQVIPGCTGRSGKNTGCRPEIENRPVKCKVVNQRKKKKDTQIPTVASTFLVATPLPLLLLLLLSSSRVAPLLFHFLLANVSLNFLCFLLLLFIREETC